MRSKQLGSKFLQRSQICSHTPGALKAGAKRSGATCPMAMPQCCYLAKGAKRPSRTTNTIKFDRIQFDPCNSIKRFNLCPFDQKNSTYLQPPTPRALNAGAKRSGATCHMAMPQCCYLAKGAKRPSHTTNMLTSSNISVN